MLQYRRNNCEVVLRCVEGAILGPGRQWRRLPVSGAKLLERSMPTALRQLHRPVADQSRMHCAQLLQQHRLLQLVAVLRCLLRLAMGRPLHLVGIIPGAFDHRVARPRYIDRTRRRTELIASLWHTAVQFSGLFLLGHQRNQLLLCYVKTRELIQHVIL